MAAPAAAGGRLSRVNPRADRARLPRGPARVRAAGRPPQAAAAGLQPPAAAPLEPAGQPSGHATAGPSGPPPAARAHWRPPVLSKLSLACGRRLLPPEPCQSTCGSRPPALPLAPP